MGELTEHEKAVMEKMSEKHKALMTELTPEMRKSFEANVNTENIGKIESWVGTDEEIKKILFWFKDGKFDDPEWQALKPVDDANRELYEKAAAHMAELKPKAVESQRKADISLFSCFNASLLYTGIAPAVRCNQAGEPDEAGEWFRGVEFRLIGSVPGVTNSITIWPLESGGYEAGFGVREGDGFSGNITCAADLHSVQQLAMLVDRRLAKAGFETTIKKADGEEITLDPRELRRASMDGKKADFGGDLRLDARKKVDSIEEALSTSDLMITWFYDRFGLETECFNLGKRFGNFYILRDENFDDFISGTKVPGKKGLVFLTATLVCRRCRREMHGFYVMAEKNPDLTFVLVNLNSPLFRFYDRVFGDMGGGNADEFRKNAAGVTPFIIVYSPNSKGEMKFSEYYGTGKSDASPTEHDGQRIFDNHCYGKD